MVRLLSGFVGTIKPVIKGFFGDAESRSDPDTFERILRTEVIDRPLAHAQNLGGLRYRIAPFFQTDFLAR